MTVRVLVVGDVLLDRDVTGRVERVCPDAPVPVLDVTRADDRPGGAGLAALLAGGPGVAVVLATGLGGGPAGERLRRLLSGAVQLHDVRPGTPTICKTRVRSRGQSLLRLDDDGRLLDDGATTTVTAERPVVDVDLLGRLLRTCDAVLVSDYGGPLTRDRAVRELIAAHAETVPVVWDPHPRGAEPVAAVTVCTPNRSEALHFASASGVLGTGLADRARALQRRWRVGAVCVTDGERGAVTALADGQVLSTSARPLPDGTDTCGAGDRFAAGVAVALGRGSDVVAAVTEAQRDVGEWLANGGVSSLTELVMPDAPIDAGHVTAAGDRPTAVPTSGPAGGVSADELVERVRAHGGTVVATGGCFDVLHAGHLGLLEQARALGDCLVVLLNSDASVRRLKGAPRPVHAAADRARLLEGLACVDAVAVFEDDDPAAMLAHLRPDVWVKGGDYREDELPEARTVRGFGGRITLVPYVDGHSTTKILEHLNTPVRGFTSLEGERP